MAYITKNMPKCLFPCLQKMSHGVSIDLKYNHIRDMNEMNKINRHWSSWQSFSKVSVSLDLVIYKPATTTTFIKVNKSSNPLIITI